MGEPSREQWLELHEAFREYCQAAPWEWFDDLDLITVEHPSAEHKGYCVVLSSGGIEYGLAVYRGDVGLVGYMGLMSGAIDSESEDMIDYTDSVSAILADRDLLPKADRDTIRSLGLRYRGRGQWPLFQAAEPGYLPWRLEADEAVFLAIALRCMTDLTLLVKKGELRLERVDGQDQFLTRTFDNGEWLNHWEIIPLPVPPPVPDYPDLERLRRLAEAKPKSGSTWELSIFYLHMPVIERRGERPYFPVLALLVDADSGFAFPELSSESNPPDADRQEMLVKILEALPAMPSEIVVNAPRTAALVESVTAPLGIELSVDETPALWSVQEAFLNTTDSDEFGFF